MNERPRSLHQRILADISGRIVAGDWPPGHRIPFEHELTEQYGCSRMTVNKALSQLARNGLIERHRRAGSFVARPRSQAAVLEIHEIRAEVEAMGLEYRYELRERHHLTATATPGGPFYTGTRLLSVSCLHFAGDRPFCLERRLISLHAVPEAEQEGFAEVPPGTWLIRHVPWSSAEHTIRAMPADRATAAALGIETGTASLVVERRTFGAKLAVTDVQLIYPGSAHAVTARFAPDGQAKA